MANTEADDGGNKIDIGGTDTIIANLDMLSGERMKINLAFDILVHRLGEQNALTVDTRLKTVGSSKISTR